MHVEPSGGGMASSGESRGASLGALRRATILVSSSTVVSKGVGLVASLAGAALLGADRLGAFAFMGATAGVLGALGVLGLGPLVTRAISDAATLQAARAKAGFVLCSCLILLVLVGLSYVLLSSRFPELLHLPGRGSRVTALTVALWGVGIGLNPLLAAIVAGYKQFRVVTGLTIVRAVLVAGGSVAGALAGGGAVGAAVGSASGEIVCAALALVWVIREGWVSAAIRNGWLDGGSNLLRTASAAGLASLIMQASMWSGQAILLRTPAGYADNGGFMLANRLLLIVTFIPNALAMTSLPYLSNRRAPLAQRRSTARRVVAWSLLAGTSVSCVLAALSYWLLPLLGDEYATYRPTIIIMSIVGVAVAANNCFGTLAVALGQLRLWVVSDVVLAISLLAGALLLVSSFGANGLAFAYLIGYVASALALAPVLRFQRGGDQLGVEVSP